MLNFLRELVKDIEDANGDYAAGIQTLPIVLGLERTAKLSAYLGVIYIFGILEYGNLSSYSYKFELLFEEMVYCLNLLARFSKVLIAKQRMYEVETVLLLKLLLL